MKLQTVKNITSNSKGKVIIINTFKKIIAAVLIATFTVGGSVAAYASENVSQVEQQQKPVKPVEPVLIYPCTTVNSADVEEISDYGQIQLFRNDAALKKQNAHDMAECARRLGYKNDSELIKLCQAEYGINQERWLKYTEMLNKVSWSEKNKQYPISSKIWGTLRNSGMSKEVVAGIMGNMMAEAGGNTLYIQPWANSGSYYGICQWSRGYYQVWNKDLNSQLAFLKKTIKYEIDTYGNNYKYGFKYEDFLKLKTPEEAATAFFKCYERGSASISVRTNNARMAYNYYTNK